MASVLRRRAIRSLRWLGIRSSPVIGISYDDRFVVVALVHAGDSQVRGVSVVELDPSTVVSGSIERPAELSSALRAALASLSYPDGTAAAACVPVGIDHRGSEWPAIPEPAGPGDHGAVVVDVARSEGLEVHTVVPVGVVGAKLGELAARRGQSVDAQQGPVSVVVRSGWLNSVVTAANRHCECRTERSDVFRTPPDVRWGVSSDKAGAQIDPFSWPKPLRDQQQIAVLAAGAAMMA